MKPVYLDHAAATPVRKEIVEAMLPFFSERFANPSSVYDLGSSIKEVIEGQREKVATLIGAEKDNVIFTASGAEANNVAVKGTALANRNKGKHVIVSAIEHHSVLNSARFLERFLDFEVTFLPVDGYGLVDPQRLESVISPETVLVSIMHGNNEIGTVQPIAELAALCRKKGVLFHTDAVASAGAVPLDVKALDVDLLTLSGPALGGPKGTGALYFRGKMRFVPLLHGGIQENGRRAGTENVPGIVGLGKAAELARQDLDGKAGRMKMLRDVLTAGIQDRIPGVIYTGHPVQRLPGHLSLVIHGVEAEGILIALDLVGIAASSGSACTSGAPTASHVLTAMGCTSRDAMGALRLTLGRENTEADVDTVIAKLPEIVARVRAMSQWLEAGEVPRGQRGN